MLQAIHGLLFSLFAHFGVENDLRQLDFSSDQRKGIQREFSNFLLHFNGGNLDVFGDRSLHSLRRELVFHQRAHLFFDFDNRLFVVLRKLALAADLGHKLLNSARNVVVNFSVWNHHRVNRRMVNEQLLQNQFFEDFALAPVLPFAL